MFNSDEFTFHELRSWEMVIDYLWDSRDKLNIALVCKDIYPLVFQSKHLIFHHTHRVAFIKRFTELEYLKCGCIAITDENLGSLNLSKMKHLDIDACHDITDKGIERLNPKIEYL